MDRLRDAVFDGFALMLATTLAGFLVLRRAGRKHIANFRVAVADSDITGFEANNSVADF